MVALRRRQRLLHRLAASIGLALLAACATPGGPDATPPPAAAPLLADALFAAPPAGTVPGPEALTGASPAMRELVAQRWPGGAAHAKTDLRRSLLAALYADADGLRLRYDDSRTRSAAEAFDARAGNCLSLVLMTAAFARELGIPVDFRAVEVEPTWDRRNGLTLAAGHVHLVLGEPMPGVTQGRSRRSELVVDFLPGEQIEGRRWQPLAPKTLLAIVYNNLAVEALGEGRTDAAYALARAALGHDPRHGATLNTLAVIYERAGHPGRAETVLRHALALDPDQVSALANLVALLQRANREREAAPLLQHLAQLRPVAPFENLERGRQAMASGDYASAREFFERELRLQPHQDEVHFWAALAWWRLGDDARAREHLEQARADSPTAERQARYAAKLQALRSHDGGSGGDDRDASKSTRLR